MATQSKYSDHQMQVLLSDLAAVLEKHQASVDLSLMALGNTVTNLLQSSVGRNQQQALAAAFCDALKNSLKPRE
ncbi:DUF1414 domain-containing protein [Testudinibacter aquarius]|uniref:UPF0352 protein EDC16_1093 n=1 Tax=Testudinibacter aquarius TaxID=1524974 RepID=A0A4R3XZK8_9PAST|nr:DUF1414 domain-containing protein [Testudinibacter aquarius]KAE9525413.1 hypothetical protein A1D24_05060 [Testudinibacter aquarius]TCV85225.1 hypothetical protein EDC16_1093 [Testudinibacter aquarius]TNG92158.1 DUF1414 domain-containing protein [Testudinibacter aquarius]